MNRHGQAIDFTFSALASLAYSYHTSFLQGRPVNAETKAITYDGTICLSNISPIGETLKMVSILVT